ncbi:synaptobrevin [Thalassiosira pseudonana CCMP1335]|uniref:Synaptobrevin n=1 Tax=Thalassiosira pseudonana TaxID=35128 RepID=B5YLP4_THAPS|nr:synaptobrevin [Thalassiosira pseudonana CCMP1335]ACI64115.1 synaptobrevin [Thalassiosira pseudonana CCMP1335]
MTIVYALVSRQKTVLAEYTATSGNFPTVTRVLLSKIPPVDGRMTYVYDEYTFHYVTEGGICFLCMSDEQNKHRIPFAFLQEVKDLFTSKYGLEVPQRAIAFSLNEEFSRTIKDRMDYYNDAGSNVDGLSAVKNQIDAVKDNMVQNIESVLERGEKIELLVDKTDRLNQAAFKFESSSRNLRRAMWWKNVRWVGFLIVAGGFFVFFVASLFCGFDFHRCKAH